jgi:hypothetical protein
MCCCVVRCSWHFVLLRILVRDGRTQFLGGRKESSDLLLLCVCVSATCARDGCDRRGGGGVNCSSIEHSPPPLLTKISQSEVWMSSVQVKVGRWSCRTLHHRVRTSMFVVVADVGPPGRCWVLEVVLWRGLEPDHFAYTRLTPPFFLSLSSSSSSSSSSASSLNA